MLSQQYIAGFFDGEGYFGIMKSKAQNNATFDYRYIPAIKVAQRLKDREVLDKIQQIYGGRLETRIHKRPNQQPSIALVFVNFKEVDRVLTDLLEYLIVKKKSATILKEFIQLGYSSPGNTSDKNREYKKVIQEKRNKLYKRILISNHVGTGLAETE